MPMNRDAARRAVPDSSGIKSGMTVVSGFRIASGMTQSVC
jgi:hypothetical protein